MKKGFLIALLVISAGIIWFVFFRSKDEPATDDKVQPVTVSKHSETFNKQFDQIIQQYYQLTEAFVNWDTVAVNSTSRQLQASIASLDMEELQKDSLIYETAQSYWKNARQNTENMLNHQDIEAKRRSLNNLSDNLYNLFRTVRYDKAKIYWQQCPMAFNDTESAFWLSETKAVRNPYLGTMHPKYGKGMLTCGEPVDTLNFMTAGNH